MSVLIHEKAKARLDRIDGSRSGSYMFYGPEAAGKATIACELARRLACPNHHYEPDPGCKTCRNFISGTYPDFHLLTAVDRPSITIEQIRQLIAALADRPYQAGGVRVALIDGAHLLTTDAQNALLKIIEEPPPRTLIILVTANPGRLLSTVKSRCAAVYFALPPAKDVAEYLITQQPSLTPSTANELVSIAEGLPGLAITLATNPAQAEENQALIVSARAVPSQTLFERLLSAAALAENKADLWRFSSLLQQTLARGIQTGERSAAEATPSFAALEQFRNNLAAKVTARVALEWLMVEF